MKSEYTVTAILLVALLAPAFVESSRGSHSAPEHPNIIYILADDMGLWAAGTYGNPEIGRAHV